MSAILRYSSAPVDCVKRVPALARSPDLTWNFVMAPDERVDTAQLGTTVTVRQTHSYAGHVGENLRFQFPAPAARWPKLRGDD